MNTRKGSASRPQSSKQQQQSQVKKRIPNNEDINLKNVDTYNDDLDKMYSNNGKSFSFTPYPGYSTFRPPLRPKNSTQSVRS